MFNDSSFLYDSDPIAFFSNEDNDEDINEMEACLTLFSFNPQSSSYKYDEKNPNNVTSFTETERYFKDEKLQEKSNDSLNETSFSLNIKEEAEVINQEQQPKNQIFFIEKKPQKKKKKGSSSNKQTRKNDADTIRRKIKPYYHKYILDTLNKMIKIKKITSSQCKSTFLKMNNRITSTVSIDYNKNLLQKTIGYILQSEHISSKYKCYEKDNNYNLIQLLNEVNDEDIAQVLMRNYGEMYDIYLKSKDYKLLLKKISLKDGESYMKQFNEISIEFLHYFMLTDSKKEKKNVSNNNELLVYNEDTGFNSFDNSMMTLYHNQENDLVLL